LRGELHCHTWHSDGDGSQLERVLLAHERGLDFLAVTDHNTTSSQLELAGLADCGLILIPGMEITTFRPDGDTGGVRETSVPRGAGTLSPQYH
jgi:predicted metal-dependent phosphoesterase TrpH